MAKRPPVGINPSIPIPIQRELRKVAQYAFDAQAGADKANAALPGKVSKTESDLLSVSSFVSKQVQANGAYPINLTGLLNGFTGTVVNATLMVRNGVIVGIGGNGSNVTSTNSGIPSVPLNPQGVPTSSTPVPSGTPNVTTLPAIGDPLSVVNQLVLLNGIPYRFTAGLTGPPGYWAIDTTGSPMIRDTWANLALYPPGNYPIGTVFYATDFLVSYAVQFPAGAAAWIYYNGIWQDVLANIPTALLGPRDRNLTFRASDYLHSWLWDGSAFSLTTGGFSPGYELFANPGPPFGGTGALWQLEDGSTVGMSQNDGTIVATTVPTRVNTWIAR